MAKLSNLKSTMIRIHREEEGMEALQAVLIIAIGAIILAFAYKVFGGDSTDKTDTDYSDTTVVGWVRKTVSNITQWK